MGIRRLRDAKLQSPPLFDMQQYQTSTEFFDPRLLYRKRGLPKNAQVLVSNSPLNLARDRSSRATLANRGAVNLRESLSKGLAALDKAKQ